MNAPAVLPTLQKFVNFWYSSSLDLFGGEISSNAADYFASGLKGRAKEDRYDDHRVKSGSYQLELLINGKLGIRDVPMRNAMNEVLRDAYVDDNQRGVDRWNDTIQKEGVDFEIKLPSRRFNRKLGLHAGYEFDLDGKPISDEEFTAKQFDWLPSEADKTYIKSLMLPVMQPGKIAQWIAPPTRGINGKPFDYEYVRRI